MLFQDIDFGKVTTLGIPNSQLEYPIDARVLLLQSQILYWESVRR